MVLKAKIIQGNNMFLGARKYKYTVQPDYSHRWPQAHTWLCNLGVKFEIQNCGVDLLEHKNSTFLEAKRLKANVKSVIYFELTSDFDCMF